MVSSEIIFYKNERKIPQKITYLFPAKFLLNYSGFFLTSYSYSLLLRKTINAEIAEYADKNRSTYFINFSASLCDLCELRVKIKLPAPLSGFSAKPCRLMLRSRLDSGAGQAGSQHDTCSCIVTLSLSRGQSNACRRAVELINILSTGRRILRFCL